MLKLQIVQGRVTKYFRQHVTPGQNTMHSKCYLSSLLKAHSPCCGGGRWTEGSTHRARPPHPSASSNNQQKPCKLPGRGTLTSGHNKRTTPCTYSSSVPFLQGVICPLFKNLITALQTGQKITEMQLELSNPSIYISAAEARGIPRHKYVGSDVSQCDHRIKWP